MSPLANMIAAPLFTVFIAGGLVGLGLTALYAPAGKAILAAIIALAQALSVFLAALTRVPFASLPALGRHVGRCRPFRIGVRGPVG